MRLLSYSGSVLLLVFVAMPAIGVGATSSPTTLAAPSPSKIVDRTLVCRMKGVGSPDVVRQLKVNAAPFEPARGGGPSPANAYVINADGGWGMRTGPLGTERKGQVLITPGRCMDSKIEVSLSRARLEGGATEPTGDNYTCDLPSRVLIRIRAVFDRPTRLIRNVRSPDNSVAKGMISKAVLAVTTEARKPIVFANLTGGTSGKAQLFVDPARCFET